LPGEFAITVANNMSRFVLSRFVVKDHTHIAGLLSHPPAIWVECHACYVDPARMDVDEKQHVVCDWAVERPDLLGKEVGCPERLHMSLDELVPSAVATFWPRVEAIFLKDSGVYMTGPYAEPVAAGDVALAIPEPSAWFLAVLGLTGLLSCMRRRR